MTAMADILVSGLTLASVYALFALGLALVYGTARVMNFAHGSIYTLAAYGAWLLSERAGLGPLSLLALLLPAMFVFGAAVEHLLIRPLRQRPDWQVATMMATLGLAFVLDNLMLVAFGPTSLGLPRMFEGTVTLGPVTVSQQGIATLIVAVAAVAALQVFLGRSRHGRAMRAVAQDAAGAAIVGIRAERVFAMTFGIACALVGLAAVLLAPVQLISPLGGWAPFLKAFVIVVFGGLGSTAGVLWGAVILGLVEAAVMTLVGAAWVMPVWFLVLLVVLMVRPRGLMGKWG
jgi:branched-chain amino acid transport system permease protein